MQYNLISLAGFSFLIVFAWILSDARSRICWRPIIGGILLQFIFAVLLFCAPEKLLGGSIPGTREMFVLFSDMFNKLIEHSRQGIVFVFGKLGETNDTTGFILAFQVLPFIIIFSSIISLLYYIGLMQVVIRAFARLFTHTMRTSAAESLSASANIFVGIEASLAIRPYLAKMTRSELFTIIVAGMASVASSVLAVYVSFLNRDFPMIAGHLMSASLLSVPATFIITKLMIPETGVPETMNVAECRIHADPDTNWIESIINGASNGAKLAFGVGITLIAFVGLLGIFEGSLGFLQVKAGIVNPVTLIEILSWAFYPFTYMMGIRPEDVGIVSHMLGTRIILTEIPAYLDLAKFAANGGDPRTLLIASYALCGFTHVASMAIFIGGTGTLAPNQLPTMTKFGPKALLAATFVTLLNGCTAGIFYWGQAGILR
ncbi:MAG TPA: nucleoside transporter [Lentisphaeria bacterium]|nr:MAG: hypothetical protein A2X45_14325 [Lentisphaerae bacterium GWF2_50_93]HCE45004.1 nucleoside transporter [Lentisphaeria bacterium]